MKSSWVGPAGKLNSSRGSWELYPHQGRSGVAPSYQRLSRDPASSAPAQGDGLRALHPAAHPNQISQTERGCWWPAGARVALLPRHRPATLIATIALYVIARRGRLRARCDPHRSTACCLDNFWDK